jgi:hypothetical protein
MTTAASIATRLPSESDYAYLAYCCYEGLSSRPREIQAAYTLYREKRGKAPKAGRYPGNFDQWRRDFKWDDRVLEHDRTAAERAIALRAEQEGEEYTKDIESHQATMLRSYRHSIAICTGAKGALVDFLKVKPKITTWTQAAIAARLIAALETSAFNLGSDALLIQPLLDQLNGDRD